MKTRPQKYLCLAIAFCLLGCDRDQLPAPSNRSSKSTTQPVSAVATTRPTTQELLAGAGKALALAPMPLKTDVPASWHIDPGEGTIPSLVGFSPHGPVKIQLMQIPTEFTDKTLPLMDKQLSKQAAESGGKVEDKPLRQLGDGPAKVRQTLEIKPDMLIERDGKLVHAPVMDWAVDVYLPMGKTYMQYTLHFDSLPLDQYRQDKEFLEKIVGTLRYAAPASSTS